LLARRNVKPTDIEGKRIKMSVCGSPWKLTKGASLETQRIDAQETGRFPLWSTQRVAHGLMCVVALGLSASTLSIAQSPQRGSIHELFAPTHKGILVVAHRGCHEPAPLQGFGYEPENSLIALEHCVAMGADMVEADVRMTSDGYLVIMHDDTVDRTTNGHGAIADITLAELRKLRLRQNLGGYVEPLTNQQVPTLIELLEAAKGQITLNLDVKDAIYPEVVEAVVRAGATDLVTVKTKAGIASAPLASIEPFEHVAFIPVLDPHGSEIAAVAEQQLRAKPVALELPHMDAADLPKLTALAKQHGIPLIVNTLGDGFLEGIGGDNDALRNPIAVWGWDYNHGISIIQTDRPEALLKYRDVTQK
jgi:glycerophosphoryl diester phosphodiesterase